MPANIATLDLNGGTPAVEIIVGHAHFARFDFSLFDATGRNPQTIGEGINSDNVPDIFPLNSPPLSGLERHTIFWRAVISSPTGAPGETYSVIVRVIQDGRVVGTDSKTGRLTDIPPEGFIRLQVR